MKLIYVLILDVDGDRQIQGFRLREGSARSWCQEHEQRHGRRVYEKVRSNQSTVSGV